MRVYVAGPYTNGDPVVNVRNAVAAAEALLAHGHLPFVPHLSMLWHLASPHEPDFWYELDLRWLEVCEALVRLPGQSVGVDNEVARARELGLPIYARVEDVP